MQGGGYTGVTGLKERKEMLRQPRGKKWQEAIANLRTREQREEVNFPEPRCMELLLEHLKRHCRLVLGMGAVYCYSGVGALQSWCSVL